ncbi:glycosyltransferase [Acidimicrobiia bacterium EGI L10123]|uniref:glycosyltransferase n=1 Tax=Salinilacustrithrix flava TaxID=2957203 RepID=UPI003D7C2D04|nr:glycosyltransferase [Acidimicrobiia bacterium EGI L10123]
MSTAVVIPVHDGAGQITRTIDAVLGQSTPPAEVVVVDNGSTDATAEVARRAGARVVHEGRRGSYAARNAGVAATTSDTIAFTDADCVPDPGWVAAIERAFARDVAIDVVGGPVVAPIVRTASERWAEARHVLDQQRSWEAPSFLPFFATANAAWRRAALERIGGFDAALASGGDVDACWRLQRVGGHLAFAPDAVVIHAHRARVGDLLAQQHRYALGHGRLDGRWSSDPAYVSAAGTAAARLRAVWLLPARVPWRAVRRRDPAIAVLDALVRTTHEVGRRRGRRQPPLDPMPAAGPPRTPATT